MSKRARRAYHCLLAVTLIVSLGGHLVLFQTIAWGNMLVTFSRSGTLSEAVQKTFDGQHPCELCKAVKKSKENDDKKPLVQTKTTLEITLPVAMKLPVPRSTEMTFRVTEYRGGFVEIYLAVPTQPPRAA